MEKWERRFAYYVFGLVAMGMMCGCVKKTIVEHKADTRVQRLERENDYLRRQIEAYGQIEVDGANEGIRK